MPVSCFASVPFAELLCLTITQLSMVLLMYSCAMWQWSPFSNLAIAPKTSTARTPDFIARSLTMPTLLNWVTVVHCPSVRLPCQTVMSSGVNFHDGSIWSRRLIWSMKCFLVFVFFLASFRSWGSTIGGAAIMIMVAIYLGIWSIDSWKAAVVIHEHFLRGQSGTHSHPLRMQHGSRRRTIENPLERTPYRNHLLSDPRGIILQRRSITYLGYSLKYVLYT